MYKPFSRKHPTLCFWLRKEGCLTTVTLWNWQKQSPEVFFKKTVLENFAIFTGKHLCWSFFFYNVLDFQGCNVKKESSAQVLFCCEIFVRHLFWKTSANGCFKTDFTKWLFGTLLLDSSFQNHPDSVLLQKYQSLSNRTSWYNSVHMPSLHLAPTLPFEPRFRMFIINGYYTKNKLL